MMPSRFDRNLGQVLRVVAACLLLAGGVSPSAALAQSEIYFAIPDQTKSSSSVDLYLANGGDTVSGQVLSKDGTFVRDFTLEPNSTDIISIGSGYRVTSDGVAVDKGFVVVSEQPIAAYLMDANTPQASNDISLLFPLEGLSQTYRVIAATSGLVTTKTSQVTIVAPNDGTQVSFTPSVALRSGGQAGEPVELSLDSMQAVMFYSLDSKADLTGSIVEASAPVAVFGGHYCGNVPDTFWACDHMIEEVPGLERWGQIHPVIPTARATAPGDYVKVLAAYDGTQLTLNRGDINGDEVDDFSEYTLDAGESLVLSYRSEEDSDLIAAPALFLSDKPVLVGQYMVGAELSDDVGDPAFAITPPPNLWLSRYIINVPTGYLENYVGVAIAQSEASSLRLDGEPLGEVELSPIPGTNMVGGNIPVGAGQHVIEADDFFMATMHGFDDYFASYFGVAGSRVSGGGGALVLITGQIPDARYGAAYEAQLEAIGGEEPYVWTVTAGALPAGVTLDPDTGLISGTPQESGLFEPTIQVSDASEKSDSVTYRLPVYNLDFSFEIDEGSPNPGDHVTLAGCYRNTSGVPLTAAGLSMTLPSGVELIDASSGYVAEGDGLFWDLGEIGAGGATVCKEATLEVTAERGAVLLAEASLRVDELDPINRSLTFQVAPVPFTAEPLDETPVEPGEDVDLVMCYSNPRADVEFPNVTLTIERPAGTLTNPERTSAGYQVNGDRVTWNIGTIAAEAPEECKMLALTVQESALGSTLTSSAVLSNRGEEAMSTLAFRGFQPLAIASDLHVERAFEFEVVGMYITTRSLPTAPVDTRYTFQLEAQGGDGSYTWELLDVVASEGLETWNGYSPSMLTALSVTESGLLIWDPLPAIPEDDALYIDFSVRVADGSGSEASATFRYTDPVIGAVQSGGGGGCAIGRGNGFDPLLPLLVLLSLVYLNRRRRYR